MSNAGWHPDPHARHELRYFDGAQWTTNVSDNGVPSVDTTGPQPASSRRAHIDAEVARLVAQGGRLEHQTDDQAVVIFGRRPNHLLHFFIGVLTLSLWWIFVWIPICIFGGEKRRIVTLRPDGTPMVSR